MKYSQYWKTVLFLLLLKWQSAESASAMSTTTAAVAFVPTRISTRSCPTRSCRSPYNNNNNNNNNNYNCISVDIHHQQQHHQERNPLLSKNRIHSQWWLPTNAPPFALLARKSTGLEEEEDDCKANSIPNDNDGDDSTNKKQSLQQNNNKDSNKKPSSIARFLLNVNFVVAYLTMALGTLLTAGLFLNLCGYGYQITSSGEVRIDTLAHLREQAQFRNEIVKSMKEYQQQQQFQQTQPSEQPQLYEQSSSQ